MFVSVIILIHCGGIVLVDLYKVIKVVQKVIDQAVQSNQNLSNVSLDLK